MRITFTMAAIADATHMTTVSKEQSRGQFGRHDDRQCRLGGRATTTRPMPAAMQKPMTALSSACQMMTLWMYLPDDPMARSVANSFR